MTQTVTQQSVKHASFAIERTFKASPKRVFAAWSTEEAKKKWFAGGPDCAEQIREFDFREGGSERLVGKWKSGKVSDFTCRYWEIIPERRIVYAYDMHLNGVRISVSLATIEFRPEGAGTHLKMTEQGAYLEAFDPNGDDAGSRERGTREPLDKLAASVDAN